MKVLVIIGSPKREGHTSHVVNKYLEPYKENGDEIETLFLRAMKISPCIACDKCHETGECVLPDDMQDIYKKMDEADCIVLSTPIYFNSVSSLTKILIDRCQKYWSKKFVLKQKRGYYNKSGVLICTAGVKHTLDSLIGATIVVDLFFKALDAKYLDTLFIDDTDKYPAIEQIDKMNEIEQKAKEHIELINEKHKI